METYHRKRSKGVTLNNEKNTLKGKEISSVVDGAQGHAPPLARQLLLDTNDEVPHEEVERGSIYELYHKNLPPRTPAQLRSIRVVMVSGKTDLNVAIRYPSILSLRTYFSDGITEMYPALDEKFMMRLELASKVLLRQVPSQEFAANKHLAEFWVVNQNSQFGSSHVKNIEDIGLARELKNDEMVRWGVRRQVMFIGKHKETSNTQPFSSLLKDDQEVKNQQENKDDEIEDEEEVDHETDQEENDDESEEEEETHDDDLEKELKSTKTLRKRKKAVKQVKHVWQVNRKPMKKCKKLAIRNPTDRWSKERYKAAELSLLEAMKEKKAMIGNPITRPALRVEARKRIGDTGLLDHLLKHVANKVAPGGNLRFRRSHNADGAMEYWLESADLLKIRKEAGVTDPLWIPPPGWKPGDSPLQDPITAKELNHLKEEISYIKREYLPKKQVEEEMAILKREIQELTSKNKQEQSQSIVVSEVVDTSPKQVMDICKLLLHSESETTDVDNSVLSREQCKEQMVVISDILKKIEAWMQASEVGKQTTTQMEAAASPKSGTELITATASSNAQEKPKVADQKNEALAPPKEPAGVDQEKSEKSGHISPPAPQTQPPPEGKAAKIERLKSGFRLCRPQGTFLWPNMVNPTTTNTSSASSMSSSQVTLQVEDLLQVVPTPPSVNSYKPPLPPYYHHHLPSPPVKPVPERRPVTVSSLSEGLPPPTTTTLINLNDIPTNPSSQQNVTTTTITPTIKLQPYGWNFPAGSKKRKSSSSSGSASSDTPSCLSNVGTPAWLPESGRHPQF